MENQSERPYCTVRHYQGQIVRVWIIDIWLPTAVLFIRQLGHGLIAFNKLIHGDFTSDKAFRPLFLIGADLEPL